MNTSFVSRCIAPVGAAVGFAVAAATTNTTSSQCESGTTKKQPMLVFLGTGSSTGCPKPLCTLLFQNNKGDGSDKSLISLKEQFARSCAVSNLASEGDPRHNKNYRNNPSLLVHHYENGDGVAKNVVIDVGKTFRETALRWMPVHGIRSLDAIILTHHHMDAVAGLDDVRGFQRFNFRIESGVSLPPQRIPIFVFLSQECLDQVSSQFPWLFPKATKLQLTPTDPNKPVVERDVAALNIQLIQDYQTFDAAGLKMTPLPVWHGDDLISLGFSFSITNSSSKKTTNVIYISDVSKMVPKTLDYIQTNLGKTDILIVDALFMMNKTHPVHFNLQQAIDLARQLDAARSFIVGMSCDGFLPHDEMNQELRKQEDIDIQLAHDGLAIPL